MFLTSHVMIAYILYRVLNLDANLWLFLFFSILPDASWPFYKNHRKESWYHTVLTFSWTIIFYPYWIAIASHFLADLFVGGIRLTQWSKRIGKWDDEEPVATDKPFPIRILIHLKKKYYTKWYNLVIEIILATACVYLFLN